LNFKNKPNEDVAIMLIVTASTVIFNLAYAVILGVIITSLVQYAKGVSK
jgi:MFS superfamily sulfate permease-like transporter